MQKIWMGLALVAALVACSKKEATSLAVEKTSDLNGQVYVNPRTQADVIFEDGEIFIQRWGEEKLKSGSYRIEDEKLVITPDGMDDITLNKDGKGGWYSMSDNSLEDLSFGPSTPEIDAARNRVLEGNKEKQDAQGASRVSLDKYVPVNTAEDLRYLVVSRHPETTDEDLARYFIPGYGQETDAFAKRELLAGLPAVKARLETFKASKDFVSTMVQGARDTLFSSPFDYMILNPYDFVSGSFDLTGLQCKDGTSTTYGAHGFYQSFVNWPKENCLIKVDEETAKVIEGFRSKSALSSNAKIYYRVLGTTKTVQGEALQLEAHQAEVSFLGDTYPGTSELGTFTIKKD